MTKLAINGGLPLRSQTWPAWPQWGSNESERLQTVLERGQWGGYDEAVSEFERLWAARLSASHCMGVSNGTASLVAALKVFGIGPGDEVLVPPYTFAATAAAVRLVGAKPVFVDIEIETFNMDVRAVNAGITPHCKAVIPVHFAGLPVDMDALLSLAEQYGLLVIEDAAHAHGSTWCGKPVGALGHVGSFSFQSSKNLTAGEGGALLTNDDDLAVKLWSYINQGRTPDGAWYEHPNMGSNLRLSGWQAAILLAQLKRLDAQLERRMENARRLRTMLEEVDGLTPLRWDLRVENHAHHLFIMRYNADGFDGLPRQKFIEALQAEGIPCSAGYPMPLYAQASLNADHSRIEPCPAAEQACQEAIWFTQNMLLAEPEGMDDIVRAIFKIRQNIHELEQT